MDEVTGWPPEGWTDDGEEKEEGAVFVIGLGPRFLSMLERAAAAVGADEDELFNDLVHAALRRAVRRMA